MVHNHKLIDPSCLFGFLPENVFRRVGMEKPLPFEQSNQNTRTMFAFGK